MRLLIIISSIFMLTSCNPYLQHFRNLTAKNGVLDRHDAYVQNDQELKNLPEVKAAYLNESNSYRITAKRALNEKDNTCQK